MTPERLGKYEVRGTLGRGAMGLVYDGWDPVIERRVAIKTVKLDDGAADEEAAEGLARFRRGAQAAGRLSHANIVGVYDFGQTAEIAYIVMEFIEGRSLKDVLDAEKILPPARVAGIMAQVLAGLEYSHKRGVVHRDIKPANVMLTSDGQVKLADFGIAKIASSDATAVGVIMGTPAYMPAEQFMGEAVDARSDIYAAGAMLFHLLTGSRPYEGSPTSIMTRVLNAPAPPIPSERSVSVSPAWDGVIGKAMARRPEDRFQSAAEFAAAVQAAAEEGTRPFVPSFAADETVMIRDRNEVLASESETGKAPAALKRRGSVAIGGGLVVAAGAAAAAWFLLTTQDAPRKAPGGSSKVLSPVNPVSRDTGSATSSATASNAVPPSSKPAPPAAKPPAPTPDAVRAGLAAALADVKCAAVRVGGHGMAVTVAGVAGRGDPVDAVKQKAATTGMPVDVQAVKEFPPVYCPAVDVLRPVIARRALNFSIDEATGPVPQGMHFHPVITDVPLKGWVQVYYLSGDGTVSGVLPSAPVRAKKGSRDRSSVLKHPADPSVLLSEGQSLRLGEKPHDALTPGIPFGTDMMVAIVSSAQLFTAPLPDAESVTDFAASLQTALNTLQSSGGSAAAGIAILDTVQGPKR